MRLNKAATAILIISILFILIFISNDTVQKESGGKYLHYLDGEESRVFLIESHLSYGVYDRDVLDVVSGFSAKKGDPCVIINGTIRNDYDRDYYFSITADLYNSEGEKVGIILTDNAPFHGFTVAYVRSGHTGYFEMHVKYDKKDIKNYDLFLKYRPHERPPP